MVDVYVRSAYRALFHHQIPWKDRVASKSNHLQEGAAKCIESGWMQLQGQLEQTCQDEREQAEDFIDQRLDEMHGVVAKRDV